MTAGFVYLGPGVRVVLGPRAELHVGPETFISGRGTLVCEDRITIGSGCAIAWDVQIMDSDFHHVRGPGRTRADSVSPVRIGNHVWVGSRATILKGVTVGDGAVIGAGAVVKHDVPAASMVAGNPARVVREGVCWEL